MEEDQPHKYHVELRGETAALATQVADTTGVPISVVLRVALAFYSWALEEERDGRDVGAHDRADNCMRCVNVAQLARDAHAHESSPSN